MNKGTRLRNQLHLANRQRAVDFGAACKRHTSRRRKIDKKLDVDVFNHQYLQSFCALGNGFHTSSVAKFVALTFGFWILPPVQATLALVPGEARANVFPLCCNV